ncbi:MAG: ABC transporter permease [Wujia sp.]
MFLHNFKYNLLITLRDKGQLFWSFIFVALLGTLFQLTFGNAYVGSELAKNLPVAVYIEDEEVSDIFTGMIADISMDDGHKMLDVHYADSIEDAEKMLENEEVIGIYYSDGGELKLMVHDDGIEEGILASVATSYHKMMTVMKSVAQKDESRMMTAMTRLMLNDGHNKEKVLSDGNMDVFTQYFYNLVAMGCLFASFAGVALTRRSQANLSSIGARKCVAQTGTFVSTTAAILANLVLLFGCEMLAILYMVLIGVDFGNKIWQMILLVLVGTLAGVTFGFFIGSISKLNENVKEGIAVGVSLGLCFMSGLMIGDMKFIVQQHCPWFNKINPAALISDSFYALNVYETNNQFWWNILSLVVISIVFTLGGVLFGRRRRYASI